MIYQFEHFEVNIEQFQIKENGELKAVEPKVFDVIAYLLINRDRIVTRDELFVHVWNNRDVSDTALSNHIKSARRILNDTAELQSVIKTIRSRGYQFVAQVKESGDANGQSSTNQTASDGQGKGFGGLGQSTEKTKHKVNWRSGAILGFIVVLGFVGIRFLGSFEDDAPYILVVPFSVSSANSQNLEPFTDQITREIIQALRKVSGAKTVPPPSAFTFKNNKQRQHIKEQIPDVNYVLDGVVSEGQDGNIRITVELEKISSGKLLWDGDYDVQLNDGDHFNVQNQIASSVADTLQVLVLESEQQVLDTTLNPDVKAYELFVQGQYQLSLMTKDSLERSILLFTQAIEIDPSFSKPYIAKANAYRILMTLFDKPRDILPKVISSAIDVLSIEPDSPQVLSSLSLAYVHAWQWEDAWRMLNKAHQQDPNNALTELGFTLYYAGLGDVVALKRHLRRAEELDPLNEEIAEWGMWALMMVNELDLAIEWGLKKRQLHPNIAYPVLSLAVAEYMRGNTQKSIEYAQLGVSLSQDEPYPLIVLAQAHAYADNTELAYKLMEEAKRKNKYMCPYETAIIFAKFNQSDKMYELLQQAIDYQSNCLIFVRNDPRFKDFYAENRYQHVLKMVGLTDQDVKKYPKKEGQQ